MHTAVSSAEILMGNENGWKSEYVGVFNSSQILEDA